MLPSIMIKGYMPFPRRQNVLIIPDISNKAFKIAISFSIDFKHFTLY